MIYWAIMLFALGVLAFADYSLTGGAVFVRANSFMFLALSLAILIRIRDKQKAACLERLKAENNDLREILTQPEISSEKKLNKIRGAMM